MFIWHWSKLCIRTYSNYTENYWTIFYVKKSDVTSILWWIKPNHKYKTYSDDYHRFRALDKLVYCRCHFLSLLLVDFFETFMNKKTGNFNIHQKLTTLQFVDNFENHIKSQWKGSLMIIWLQSLYHWEVTLSIYGQSIQKRIYNKILFHEFSHFGASYPVVFFFS